MAFKVYVVVTITGGLQTFLFLVLTSFFQDSESLKTELMSQTWIQCQLVVTEERGTLLYSPTKPGLHMSEAENVFICFTKQVELNMMWRSHEICVHLL